MLLLLLSYALFSVNFLSVLSASQPEALFRFRASLPNNSQILLPWNQSSSPSAHCQWTGVSCYSNRDFRVKSLNLTVFGLYGVLENSISELCTLPGLVSLDLSGNNFTGSVPRLLGNCSRLDTIILNDNGFSGPIPAEIFKSGQIRQLELGYNQLSGMIPPEVGECKSLEYFGLYNNLLSGQIPSELFSLPNLKFLYLSTNNLTGALPNLPSSCLLSDLRIHENSFFGSIPLSLSNCYNLRILYASYNNLGGIIPQNIFKDLKKVEILHLARNKFQGEIPVSLWGLRNLQELVIPDNRFNGSIPEDLGQCSQLTYLDLSGNSLTGQIPTSVGSLRSLENLFLYNNRFNGFLPPEIGNCTSLIELRLDDNHISGVLPPDICDLHSLKALHVSNNQIEGHVPHCIERLTYLEELALYGNRLTGNIPPGISNLTNLTFLSLAHNNFTGEVPSDLGKNYVPGLVRLDLTGNHLTGEIPRGICSGNSLSVLTLGYNQFTGSIPIEIIRSKSLTRVILRNNLLQGSIPDDMENGSSISYFDLQGNLLEGKIPTLFGFWRNLSLIDLSENKFSGSVPQEFGGLQNLQVLRISSNRLTGEIPRELAHCPRITELDLSKNYLSGGVPSEIISSLTLQIIRLEDNNLTGTIPDNFSSSQNLHELQLANNMLEGIIPCSLSHIHHFSSVLNLSTNQLSGKIPKCLGNLDNLEILDISNNNFSGEIPSEVNSMVSLSYLNISFNQLLGQVPAGWAKILKEHPGSSFGNPRLCLATNSTSDYGTNRKSHNRVIILTVVLTGSLLLVVCSLVSLYKIISRYSHPSSPHLSLLGQQPRSEELPEDLSFEDILRATEGWSDKYVIGRGRHGTVYRTESKKSRKHWAVKKVDLSETKFSTEMRTLSSVKHRNVVRMGGYSIRDGYGFIVTNYMPGGTLYDVLHKKKAEVTLNWETRYRIALGIAQGLSYLHHDCVPQVIHRDIKSDNILLDSELDPKIGDFGLAKVDSDTNQSLTVSAIVGTLGYIAPENAYSTRLTDKCDVYSYGVILLELLCRKLPVDPSFDEGLDIVSWVRKNLQSHTDCSYYLDEEIWYWDKENQREALGMMDVALQCTEMVPEVRPSMRDVVGSLIKLNCRKYSMRCDSSL